MKGLEIARAFFFEWGQPFLEKEFPELTSRLAAGRLMGSDVLGADDDISRDHSWGPQFFLFLSAADHASSGARVSQAMNAAAPNPWRGWRLAGADDQSVVVVSIPAWFHDHLGLSQPPRDAHDWALLNESKLYFIRHGDVWVDGTGELSVWRTALKQYPTDILNARLASECFRIWHHGEYNFARRMAKRQDSVATAICLGEFVSGVMRIVLLLRGDFSPYWKWLPFEFRKLPESAIYTPLLEELIASSDARARARVVRRICARVHEQLVASGSVTGRGGNPWFLPLLNDYDELRAKSFKHRPLPEPS